MPSVWHARIRSYTRVRVIIIIFFFSKQNISGFTGTALIFSLNVSTVDGGVHGHQAIVFLAQYTSIQARSHAYSIGAANYLFFIIFSLRGRTVGLRGSGRARLLPDRMRALSSCARKALVCTLARWGEASSASFFWGGRPPLCLRPCYGR